MKRLVLVLLFLSTLAHAATAPIYLGTPKLYAVQMTTSPGTYVDVVGTVTNTVKCVGLYVTSNDNAANPVTVQIQKGATKVGGVTISVPASSGFTTAIPAVNFMSGSAWPGLPIDGQGNPYFYLENGDELQATFTNALTSEVINVVAICGTF